MSLMFIRNKKEWKEVVRRYPELSIPSPLYYPCWGAIFSVPDAAKIRSELFVLLDKKDLESMIQKIDSGREF